MNSDDIYNAWKEKKGDIKIQRDFADQVMDQIYDLKVGKRRIYLIDTVKILGWLSSKPWAQAGVVIVGAIIGFIRFLLTIRVVLG